MRRVELLLVIVAMLQGGWMSFDGGRALWTGDYITPTSGPSAGRLGPWASIVSAAGVNPRARFMKLIFVVLGLLWLADTWALALAASWARALAVALSVATLWYAPIGTLNSLIVLLLVWVSRLRH